MLHNFLSFLNENKTESYEKLKRYPYIIEDDGKLKIRKIMDPFPECLTSNKNMVDLKYSTMVRFLLYGWIYKYEGNNQSLIDVKNNLQNSINYNGNFAKIANNRSIQMNIFGDLYHQKDTEDKDYDKLLSIIENRNKYFNEKTVSDMLGETTRISKYSDASENYVIELLKKKGIIQDIKLAGIKWDLMGVDIFGIYKGKNCKFQVKRTDKYTNVKGYWTEKNDKKEFAIEISNDNLDLKKSGTKFMSDYIILYYTKSKLAILIDTKYINDIEHIDKKIIIHIEANDDTELKNRLFKRKLDL